MIFFLSPGINRISNVSNLVSKKLKQIRERKRKEEKEIKSLENNAISLNLYGKCMTELGTWLEFL